VITGAIAIAGLIVVQHDARHIYHGLTTGYGLAAVIVSSSAGLATLALIWGSRFQPARVAAAIAVAAVVAGWAAAQRPTVLPGLTLHQAAAGRDVLIAVIVSVVLGGLILAPSLALLFRLVLTGALDPSAQRPPEWALPAGPITRRSGVHSARRAAMCLLGGFVLLTLLDNAIAHVFGVLAFVAAALQAFAATAPDEVADLQPSPTKSNRP
jgi:cytochrome d ubiquinol oxidase subunit II